MKRLAVLALVLLAAILSLGASCPPRPPTPTPTPTPEPTPTIVFTDMLLRKCGTGQFCHSDPVLGIGQQPVDFAGCILCCKSFEEGNAGWPMASDAAIDFCQTQGRANFFHMRPGPFLVGDEPDLAGVGGAYVEVDGKADLTQWNQKFWDWFAARVEYAGRHGAWVEVDLIDSWRLKGGCPYSPWNAGRNIQGEDRCQTTHRGTGDAVADAYLRKLIETVGKYANVIFQIGNESGQVAGKNVGLFEWERWVRDRVRLHEQEVGLGVVHMIGTNSDYYEIESANWIDYINRHGTYPDGPAFGKPSTNNEGNPAPRPDAYLALYCAARLSGAYVWAWRSELEKPDWDLVLSSISEARLNNCKGFDPGACPFEVPQIAFIKVKPHGTDYYDSTPLVSGGKYCRDIGFTDGRTICAVRTEGDPFRGACEQKAIGGDGEIKWWLSNRVGTIDILVRHSGFQFAVTGNGSAQVHCGVPAQPGKDLCRSGQGGPVLISR